MMTHRLKIRSGLARRFIQEQEGAGAVLGIFIFMAFVLIAGVALDGTNLWRHQQLLKQTADVAAHAGTVELAKGNTPDDAYDRARIFVEQNMPSTWYGNLFGNPEADIRVVHYDPDADTLDITGPQNAVLVQLHRNGNSQNPVPTFMLRLADVLTMGVVTDVSDWNVYTAGVVAFVGTKKCVSTDGLYARAELNLTSSSSFGSGYCLHSQDNVWMPQQNYFADRAGLSMPNLDDCGSKCDDVANPGATAASFERNLIMEDLSQHLQNVEQSFLGTSDTTIRDEFFQNKSIGDLSPLAAIGVDTSTISQRGETVNLSQSDFEALTAVPSGLTYNVSCTGGGKAVQFGTPNGKVKPSFGGGTINVSDVAVITNCALDFGSDSRVKSSVILTNLESSNASINASSGAQVGTSSGMCDPGAQSTILGKSDMHVPADFAGSNVSFIVDGDIHLSASSSSTTINHSGISLHSSGEIKVAANHTFDPCNNPPSGLMPTLKVIRHVEPTGNKFAATATN